MGVGGAPDRDAAERDAAERVVRRESRFVTGMPAHKQFLLFPELWASPTADAYVVLFTDEFDVAWTATMVPCRFFDPSNLCEYHGWAMPWNVERCKRESPRLHAHVLAVATGEVATRHDILVSDDDRIRHLAVADSRLPCAPDAFGVFGERPSLDRHHRPLGDVLVELTSGWGLIARTDRGRLDPAQARRP